MKRRYQQRSSYGANRRRRYVDCEDESSDSSSDSSSAKESVPSNDHLPLITYNEFSEGVARCLTSSPVQFLNERDSNATNTTSTENSSDSDVVCPLYAGAGISCEEFSSKFLNISCKHQITDAASESFLKLFTETLPLPNRCPTLRKIKEYASISKQWTELDHNGGKYYFLDLKCQLRRIIANNPDMFTHVQEVSSDIRNADCFHFIDTENVKYVYIILNIDGIASVFQSRQFKIWSMMATIVNVTPKKRRKFQNLFRKEFFRKENFRIFSEFQKISECFLPYIMASRNRIFVFLLSLW